MSLQEHYKILIVEYGGLSNFMTCLEYMKKYTDQQGAKEINLIKIYFNLLHDMELDTVEDAIFCRPLIISSSQRFEKIYQKHHFLICKLMLKFGQMALGEVKQLRKIG